MRFEIERSAGQFELPSADFVERGCAVSTAGSPVRWLQTAALRRRLPATDPPRLAWRIWESAHRRRHGDWRRMRQDWPPALTANENTAIAGVPASAAALRRSPYQGCATFRSDLASGVGCERGPIFRIARSQRRWRPTWKAEILDFRPGSSQTLRASHAMAAQRASGLLSYKLDEPTDIQ
jgi:hypothetical protein